MLNLILESFNGGSILTPEQIDSIQIRYSIESAGFNLEMSEIQINQLSGTQFRDFKSGRGLAMGQVLGSKQDQFIDLVKIACAESNWSIKGDKTRGAMQFAADLISVAVGAITKDEFCDKTNRRILKSIDHKIDDKITSLPAQAATEIINFLMV